MPRLNKAQSASQDLLPKLTEKRLEKFLIISFICFGRWI